MTLSAHESRDNRGGSLNLCNLIRWQKAINSLTHDTQWILCGALERAHVESMHGSFANHIGRRSEGSSQEINQKDLESEGALWWRRWRCRPSTRAQLRKIAIGSSFNNHMMIRWIISWNLNEEGWKPAACANGSSWMEASAHQKIWIQRLLRKKKAQYYN